MLVNKKKYHEISKWLKMVIMKIDNAFSWNSYTISKKKSLERYLILLDHCRCYLQAALEKL